MWTSKYSQTHHCGYAYQIESDGKTVDQIQPDGGSLINSGVASLVFNDGNLAATFACINPLCGDDGISTTVTFNKPSDIP